MASYTPKYSNVPIGSTSEVKGGLFHSRGKDAANAENDRRATLALAAYQNDLNVENWMRQNEYNSPENQMARYRSAGLNPNLIYGQLQNADGVASANVSPTNFYDSPNEMETLQMASESAHNFASIIQNNQNLRYQYDALQANVNKDYAIAQAQIASSYRSDKLKAKTSKEIAEMQSKSSSDTADKDRELRQKELDAKKQEIENEMTRFKENLDFQREKLNKDYELGKISASQKNRELAILENKEHDESLKRWLEMYAQSKQIEYDDAKREYESYLNGLDKAQRERMEKIWTANNLNVFIRSGFETAGSMAEMLGGPLVGKLLR